MKAILKVLFLCYIIIFFITKGTVNFLEVSLLLLIIAINIYKEKYLNHKYVSFVNFLLILTAAFFERSFAILLCIVIYDFVIEQEYIGVLLSVAGLVFLVKNDAYFIQYLLLVCICMLIAYILKHFKQKNDGYKSMLDDERRIRYELESVKARLLNSSKETARLAEISERNRIAREIHDNIGHRLAGILIQLEAGMKIKHRDPERADKILAKSIHRLSESLTMIRDTVHRLKPTQKVGVDYIKEIIGNFKFCEVQFKLTGDFSMIPAAYVEVIATNIKEALTNASRHANATNMEIAINVNGKFIRLLIKDNGKGCKNIKQGMGLSGMRERVKNAGGTFSVSGSDGFMIVCILPMIEGVEIFENRNRR